MSYFNWKYQKENLKYIFRTWDFQKLSRNSPALMLTILMQMLNILWYAAGLSPAAYHKISSVWLQYCQCQSGWGNPLHVLKNSDYINYI